MRSNKGPCIPMSKHVVQPVILCGGSGTRLWPLSRTGFPKQFLCLTGKESLFQLAVGRLEELEAVDIEVSPPLIVTGEDHRFLALEQLREIGVQPRALLLEPVGRNTAPALSLGALCAQEGGGDPVLVVTPADHVVMDHAAFASAMQSAILEASSGAIVVLGVAPDRPETGFGYIKANGEGNKIMTVGGFVEKPDLATAQQYLDDGGYYWNAGIFVMKASIWLQALECFCPEVFGAVLQAWAQRSIDAPFVRVGREEFSAVPSKSIDYGVMEHCPGSKFAVRVVQLEAGWSDLGVWEAVWSFLPKDELGNAHLGDVVAVDSRNTLVHASSRLVSLVGVEDLVVIETPDAILVADRAQSQKVRCIVDELGIQEREEHALHRKVHRPWGWYDCIEEGPRFKVKRIQVKPKASLSMQMHHHRTEHWVVVRGTAEIRCGDKTILLSENQSAYIPLGELHRLTNPGSIPLEIIEVQSGSYLGEDDIVRYDDSYGRNDVSRNDVKIITE